MWTGTGEIPPEIVAACGERGLTPVTASVKPTLGSVIGRNPAAVADSLLGKMEEYDECFEGVKAVARVDSQAAQLLLRYCMLGKPLHLLRTHPTRHLPHIHHTLR